MNLEYVGKKIENVLNNANNPLYTDGFYFFVATDGFYLDRIDNKLLKKNVIPVFVGYQSGEITPIEGLEEVDYNVNVSVYFPIAFKEKFYKLEKYLMTTFVGKIVDFGYAEATEIDERVSNALCNISIPTFTTIADAGLIEFKKWTSSTYGLAVETADFWMQMKFLIYTSTIKNLKKANGFCYGNEVKTTLSFATATTETLLRIGTKDYIRNNFLDKTYSLTKTIDNLATIDNSSFTQWTRIQNPEMQWVYTGQGSLSFPLLRGRTAFFTFHFESGDELENIRGNWNKETGILQIFATTDYDGHDNPFSYRLSATYTIDNFYGFANISDSNDIVYLVYETPTVGQNYYKYINDVMVVQSGTISTHNYPLAEEEIITTNPSIQSQSEPTGQQLLGEKETEGLAINTSYSSGFNCYFKNDVFFRVLLRKWFSGVLQNEPFIVKIELLGYQYQRTCYLQSCMFNPIFGEPITLTFTFIKKVV